MSIKRILLRAGKDPTTPFSVEDSLHKNVAAGNTGNMLFYTAVYKTLSTAGVEIVPNYYKVNKNQPQKINEEFDAFVIPLANAFRPSFIAKLDKYTKFIQKLTIPVIVPGVGVQATLDYNTSNLRPYKENIYSFVKAVLAKSASIGVRGECTHQYLKSIGFHDLDIDIIGCPSMFLNGANLTVKKTSDSLNTDSLVSINITPSVKAMEAIFTYNFNIFKNLVYIPQNNSSLKQMLWTTPASLRKSNIPHHLSHPMFKEDRIRFFVDPITWINYLKSLDFTFGSRIHGNIASLLAGTPAYVLAHDSRTLEIAKYFQIPHSCFDSLSGPVSAIELFESADYSKLLDGHQSRFEKYKSFLEKNELSHIFQKSEDNGKAFEDKLAKANFPPAVKTPYVIDNFEILSRINWLKENHEKRIKELEKRTRKLFAKKKE